MEFEQSRAHRERGVEPEITNVLAQARWVYVVPTMPEQLLTLRTRSLEVMLVTDAMIHVYPCWFGPSQFAKGPAVTVRAANRQMIRHWGQRVVSLGVLNVTLSFSFEVAVVKRPVLSVGLLTSAGWRGVFDKTTAFLRSPRGRMFELVHAGGLSPLHAAAEVTDLILSERERESVER